jgi:hypothetical protein
MFRLKEKQRELQTLGRNIQENPPQEEYGKQDLQEKIWNICTP